jgi:hypothetical protein
MKQNYRHGEIALIGVNKLPEGLIKSDSKIIMSGSHGNNHEINQGDLYFKNVDQFIFGYLVAKNTALLHPEHGKNNLLSKKIAKIKNGIYELRKQQEYTPNGLKPVID